MDCWHWLPAKASCLVVLIVTLKSPSTGDKLSQLNERFEAIRLLVRWGVVNEPRGSMLHLILDPLGVPEPCRLRSSRT